MQIEPFGYWDGRMDDMQCIQCDTDYPNALSIKDLDADTSLQP